MIEISGYHHSASQFSVWFFFLNGPYFILMLFAASADITLGHVAMLILVWLIVQTYWFASACFMPLFSLNKGLNLI